MKKIDTIASGVAVEDTPRIVVVHEDGSPETVAISSVLDQDTVIISPGGATEEVVERKHDPVASIDCIEEETMVEKADQLVVCDGPCPAEQAKVDVDVDVSVPGAVLSPCAPVQVPIAHGQSLKTKQDILAAVRALSPGVSEQHLRTLFLKDLQQLCDSFAIKRTGTKNTLIVSILAHIAAQ